MEQTNIETMIFTGVISLMIIIAGLIIIKQIHSNHPLVKHILQLAAFTFILPVLLCLTAFSNFPMEATTGILGTIVGYFFGTKD